MFESLKKKFSRTSEKLEEELIEEAEAEDNLQEEEGTRFSFFSFGRKNKEENKEDEDEDESNLLPEAEDTIVEDETSVDEIEEEAEEGKKSGFFSRFKSSDETDEEDDESGEEEDFEVEEKKSHFWSRSKNKDKEDISIDGEASGGLFSFVREKTISEKHVDDILFELEMELLQGDVAMEVASEVVESVKTDLVGKKIKRTKWLLMVRI